VSSGQTISGYENVSAGETIESFVVASGGFVIVEAGGIASGTEVHDRGTQDIYAGGTAIGTILLDASGAFYGADEYVYSGGTAISTSVVGGFQDVSSGGTSSDTVLTGPDGQEYVYGTAYDTTVSNGGVLVAQGGGTVLDAVVSTGGQIFALGYSAVSSDGQIYEVEGTAAGTTLYAGAQDVVGLDGLFGGTGISISTTVDSGATQTINAGSVASSTLLNSGGVETISSAGIASNTVVNGGGVQYVYSGGTASGTTINSGGAELVVSSGGTADLTNIKAGGIEVIDGFGVTSATTLNSGGTIDLPDFVYSSGGSATLDTTNDRLTVIAGMFSSSLLLASSYTGEFFNLKQDSGDGTDITLTGTAGVVVGTPCYCRGTLILTDRGEVAVEALAIGDRLVTLSGMARPIVWIGRRSYSGRFAAGNRDVLPVLIRQNALADGVPRRVLLVSPLHAMYLDGVLIPAAALVNGSSIVQIGAPEAIEYVHLELETHDVILAEGAASETFVDDGSRGMFHNAGEFAQHHPGAPNVPARYCAPRVEDGERLHAVRRRLAARTEAVPQAAAPGRLFGRLDVVDESRISGWARDDAFPDGAVRLRVLDNGVTIGEVSADRYRPDLEKAGIGGGCHGFELIVTAGLSPLVRHVIQVQRASDAQELPNSPWVLEAVPQQAVMALPATAEKCAGRIDTVAPDRITGWAQDGDDPDVPVALQILDNGRLIARVLANRYRADLERAGIGRGRHSFDVAIPGGLSPLARHVIQIRRERDGAELGVPTVLEAASSFDAILQQTIENAVASVQAEERDTILSFFLRQAERLRQSHADGQANRSARMQRALIVDDAMPVAGRDAGSQAILSHARALQRLGYTVSLAAAEAMARPEPALAELGITVCCAPIYHSVEEVLRRRADGFDLVYLHRANVAARYLALARQCLPRARILYSVADLHYLRLERQAAIEERPELLAASRRMRLAECTAAWSADAVITHSGVEADLLRRAVPEAKVYQVPWEVIPRVVPRAGRGNIALIGNYAHAPNEDAARWLVESVMPLVWQIDPSIVCHLAGSDMTDIVRALHGPRVVAVGRVDDLGTDVLAKMRLTVAPLRFGAGIKGKVLESFAAGVPCVMSDVAAEGMDLPTVLAELIGRDPAALAALICRLNADDSLHGAAVEAGLDLIRRDFSGDRVVAALGSAIEGTGVKAAFAV
jgi:autotransporter passenger strand-loop-strand repeat protein